MNKNLLNRRILLNEDYKKNMGVSKSNRIPNKKLVSQTPVVVDIDEICDIKQNLYDFIIKDCIHKCFIKKGSSKYLYVFLTGYRRDVKRPRPDFSRWSWYTLIADNVLCIDNPMYLTYPNIRMGWFLGDKNIDFIKSSTYLIEKIAKILNIEEKNIIIYGSSAAGTAAAHISANLPYSTSISINMQFLPNIDIEKQEDYELNIGYPVTQLGLRADTQYILDNSKSNHIIIVNGESDEDRVPLLKYVSDRDVKIYYGLNKVDNIWIWIYDAHGVPDNIKAHSAFESKAMYIAIDKLAKDIINNKNIDYEHYIILSELWCEHYDAISAPILKQVDLLMKSDKEHEKTLAFKICLNNRGNRDALRSLAKCYEFGIGTCTNYEKAYEVYSKLISMGDHVSQTDYDRIELLNNPQAQINDYLDMFNNDLNEIYNRVLNLESPKMSLVKKNLLEHLIKNGKSCISELKSTYDAMGIDFNEFLSAVDEDCLTSGDSYQIYRILKNNNSVSADHYLMLSAMKHYWRAEIEYIKKLYFNADKKDYETIINMCLSCSNKTKPFAYFILSEIYGDMSYSKNNLNKSKEYLRKSKELGYVPKL